MRTSKLLFLSVSLCVSSSLLAKDLTVETIHQDAGLSGPSLRGPALSPNGKQVTVLQGRADDARQLDLWAYDLESGGFDVLVDSKKLVGETELSEEEKNRRERQRIYDTGIVSYSWDKNGEALLFPLGGDVYLYDLKSKKPVQITDTKGFETDAKVSPQGEYVSYVRNNELFVYDRSSNKEQQVTSGADGLIRNGISEFVAQEELDRDTGYWWSPDDQHIAFLQIDENPVEIAERLDFGAEGTKTIRQRYPFAGTNNVLIKVGITDVNGKDPVWVELSRDPDIYVGDVYWSADGKNLYVSRLSRDQKTLELLKVNPKTGRSTSVLSEHSDTWINLNKSFHALKDGGFLWGSERNGFHHLYRYGADGLLMYAVTEGDWPIQSLKCVDEKNGEVYFTGWQKSALETHLFKVGIEGGDITQISQGEGRHGASFAGDCSTYIGSFNSNKQPLQMAAYDNSGKRLIWLKENKVAGKHPYAPYLSSHVKPQFGTIKAKDGTPMDYKLLVPSTATKANPKPAIVLVYGGPHAQRVHKGWNRPFEQLLVDQGYVVFMLDNRGAGNRGKAFEAPLYRNMGHPEVEDQAIGTRWLAKQPFVDAKRIGVYGWSYGGYMTIMMLAQNPELYTAGVSGAPVTDWALYDTAYTERYMGHPKTDAKAYENSAVFAHLDGLKGEGELLLIHGMADDNVVFLHAIKLMDELQKSGKNFELMTYPGEKHGFRSKQNRIHKDQLILDFFERKLNK